MLPSKADAQLWLEGMTRRLSHSDVTGLKARHKLRKIDVLLYNFFFRSCFILLVLTFSLGWLKLVKCSLGIRLCWRCYCLLVVLLLLVMVSAACPEPLLTRPQVNDVSCCKSGTFSTSSSDGTSVFWDGIYRQKQKTIESDVQQRTPITAGQFNNDSSVCCLIGRFSLILIVWFLFSTTTKKKLFFFNSFKKKKKLWLYSYIRMKKF